MEIDNNNIFKRNINNEINSNNQEFDSNCELLVDNSQNINKIVNNINHKDVFPGITINPDTIIEDEEINEEIDDYNLFIDSSQAVDEMVNNLHNLHNHIISNNIDDCHNKNDNFAGSSHDLLEIVNVNVTSTGADSSMTLTSNEIDIHINNDSNNCDLCIDTTQTVDKSILDVHYNCDDQDINNNSNNVVDYEDSNVNKSNLIDNETNDLYVDTTQAIDIAIQNLDYKSKNLYDELVVNDVKELDNHNQIIHKSVDNDLHVETTQAIDVSTHILDNNKTSITNSSNEIIMSEEDSYYKLIDKSIDDDLCVDTTQAIDITIHKLDNKNINQNNIAIGVLDNEVESYDNLVDKSLDDDLCIDTTQAIDITIHELNNNNRSSSDSTINISRKADDISKNKLVANNHCVDNDSIDHDDNINLCIDTTQQVNQIVDRLNNQNVTYSYNIYDHIDIDDSEDTMLSPTPYSTMEIARNNKTIELVEDTVVGELNRKITNMIDSKIISKFDSKEIGSKLDKRAQYAVDKEIELTFQSGVATNNTVVSQTSNYTHLSFEHEDITNNRTAYRTNKLFNNLTNEKKIDRDEADGWVTNHIDVKNYLFNPSTSYQPPNYLISINIDSSKSKQIDCILNNKTVSELIDDIVCFSKIVISKISKCNDTIFKTNHNELRVKDNHIVINKLTDGKQDNYLDNQLEDNLVEQMDNNIDMEIDEPVLDYINNSSYGFIDDNVCEQNVDISTDIKIDSKKEANITCKIDRGKDTNLDTSINSISKIDSKVDAKIVSKVNSKLGSNPIDKIDSIVYRSNSLTQNTTSAIDALVLLSNNNSKSTVSNSKKSSDAIRLVSSTKSNSPSSSKSTSPSKKLKRKFNTTNQILDSNIKLTTGKDPYSYPLNNDLIVSNKKTDKAITNKVANDDDIDEEWSSQYDVSEQITNKELKKLITNKSNEFDIPSTLSSIDELAWSVVWIELQANGWRWSRGSGLISYYYLRPNKTSKPPNRVNIDYFTSEDDVLEYINKHLTNRSTNQTTKNSTKQSTKRVDNEQLLVDNFMKIRFADVWIYLTNAGWTWTYGSGVIRVWYIIPGESIDTAITGVSKFPQEESVIKYLIKSRKHIDILNNITRSQVDRYNKYFNNYEQLESQSYLYDDTGNDQLDNWNLTTNRKKRKSSSSLANPIDNTSASDNSSTPSPTPKAIVGSTLNSKKSKSSVIDKSSIKPTNKSSAKSVKHALTAVDRPIDKPIVKSIDNHIDKSIYTTSKPSSNHNLTIHHSTSPRATSVSTTPSTKSKSAINSSNSKIRYKSNLLTNYVFILSGLDSEYRDNITNKIIQYNGKVVESFDDNANSKHTFVLSNTTAYRRNKVLLAIIKGIHVLHYSWLEDTIVNNEIESIDRYILTCGTSIDSPYHVLPQTNSSNKLTAIFQSKKFLNLSNDSWNDLILLLGGTLVEYNKQICKQILNNRNISIDYIVIDSYIYSETVTNNQLETVYHKKLNKAVDSYLSADIIGLIESCQRRNNALGFIFKGLNIVSIDWIVQCIVSNRYIDINDSDIYTLPREPFDQPNVIKENGDRYIVDDIISYNHEDSQVIGRILSFHRRVSNHQIVIHVTIQRFDIYIDNDEDSYLTPKSIDDEMNIQTIKSSSILSKVIVFPRQLYNRLSYTGGDGAIFCSSQEWEEDEEERRMNETNGLSQSSQINRFYRRQQSQDY